MKWGPKTVLRIIAKAICESENGKGSYNHKRMHDDEIQFYDDLALGTIRQCHERLDETALNDWQRLEFLMEEIENCKPQEKTGEQLLEELQRKALEIIQRDPPPIQFGPAVTDLKDFLENVGFLRVRSTPWGGSLKCSKNTEKQEDCTGPFKPNYRLTVHQSAEFIGVGVTLFRSLVKDGRMPRPDKTARQHFWNSCELSAALRKLPRASGVAKVIKP